jgi:hypothetical protein
VDLDYNSGLAAFSGASRRVPAFVTGRLSGRAVGGEVVAIAVNGRVAAVTRSFRDGAEVRLGAMVSPEVLRSGGNDVDAFAVSGAGSAIRLSRAGGTGVRGGSLVQEGGKLVAVITDGWRIPVRPGAVDGWLDASSEAGGSVISGWATDARHRRAADRVLLFDQGRLVEATAPSRARADVVEEFRSFGVAKSGFRFTGYPGSNEAVESGELVAVALSGRSASELALSR